jgi:hypothetical protein
MHSSPAERRGKRYADRDQNHPDVLGWQPAAKSLVMPAAAGRVERWPTALIASTSGKVSASKPVRRG